LKSYIDAIVAGLDINSYAKTDEVTDLIAAIDLSSYA